MAPQPLQIVLAHYSAHPVTGGVERIMEQQRAGFGQAGHRVRVLAGSGDADLLPGLQADQPLYSSPTTSTFPSKVNHLEAQLHEKFRGADVVILHNLLSMPFAPAATTALWRLPEQLPQTLFINWIHDLAAINPDYTLPAHPPETWNLLRQAPPRMTHVAVSESRRQQFQELTGATGCHMIPNGIDTTRWLGLPASLSKRLQTLRLSNRYPVLLHPARLLRRKNIEFTLAMARAWRDSGLNPLCLVTGAVDPHQENPYTNELLELRREWRLDDHVCFAGGQAPLNDAEVRALYHTADLLFFPSRSEGFGLPLLEAGLTRTPVFCSDIAPHRAVADGNASFFPLSQNPEELARRILLELEQSAPHRLRRRILERFDFERVILPMTLEILTKERRCHGQDRG